MNFKVLARRCILPTPQVSVAILLKLISHRHSARYFVYACRGWSNALKISPSDLSNYSRARASGYFDVVMQRARREGRASRLETTSSKILWNSTRVQEYTRGIYIGVYIVTRAHAGNNLTVCQNSSAYEAAVYAATPPVGVRRPDETINNDRLFRRRS